MATKTDPLVHMGTITGGEARELLKSNPVILLPMGSHEDQGPHAPMGDYLLAEKIAELAALQASKAGTRTLVAPNSIAVSKSPDMPIDSFSMPHSAASIAKNTNGPAMRFAEGSARHDHVPTATIASR